MPLSGGLVRANALWFNLHGVNLEFLALHLPGVGTAGLAQAW